VSEDRGFEVIDKRRVSAEGVQEADAGTEAQAGAEPEGESAGEAAAGATGDAAQEPSPGTHAEARAGEATEGGPEGFLPDMDATNVVSLCINMLHEVAWVKMGLVPSPMSGKIDRDLAESRLAIDCIADLVRHLDSRVDERARRDLQNLVSTLRMNFVQQSQR
jgi:hypothetical protein